MSLPPQGKPYALKSRVEHAIDEFAAKKQPQQADLNKVLTVAQMAHGLVAYRAKAKDMSVTELQNEKHLSARMARYLTESGDPRPNDHCHAHAIISGAHPQAVKLRAVLAWVKMRIDDPHNGCWLPKNTAAKPHMPKRLCHAVPHSRIHRFNYYFWLNQRISLVRTPVYEKLAQELAMIERQLHEQSFPPFVMKKKGEG